MYLILFSIFPTFTIKMATGRFILYQPFKDRNDKSKLNPDETRLYFYLIIDRTHIIKVKTEHKIYPEKWDFAKQCLKEIPGNKPGTPELNRSIDKFNKDLIKLKDEILLKYRSTVHDYPDLTFQQVSKIITNYGKGKEVPFNANDKTLLQVLDEYIKYLSGEVTDGTIKKFTSLKNSLTDFRPDITFSGIDHKFLDDYRKHLRSVPARGRQKRRPDDQQTGLLLATQGKYIESLKNFLKWSTKRGYNKNLTYLEFKNISEADKKHKKSNQEIVALTLSELRQFYSFKFENVHYSELRDLFCFGCFTGQRWGDYSNFHKQDLDGDVWTFRADKTKKRIAIDLTGFAEPALDILKRYNYELPKFKLQNFNDDVKKAAKEAGLTEMTRIIRSVNSKQEIVIEQPKYYFITSHTARRTFVSIMLNDYNMSIIHVMGVTGHTDVKTLQKYIKEDRTARRKAISGTKRIDDLLKAM
jgi:integrase